MTKIPRSVRERAALLCQVAASNVGTENYLDEAVRLARLVDDYATNGTRHTMPGGYVADISRALVAVVAERNALLAEREHNLSRIDSLEEAVHAEHARAEHIGADMDNLRARAERAEAIAAVSGGEWCLGNRAAGRDVCGACAICFAEMKGRAERAEAALHNVRALAKRLRRKDPENAGHLLRFTEPFVTVNEILRTAFPPDAQAIRADERTRTAEEIAAWHDAQAGTWDASMNDKVSRARADGRRRGHEASAAHIRATWGCNRDSSVAEGESR